MVAREMAPRTGHELGWGRRVAARLGVAVLLAGGGIAVLATPVSAHVEPDPSAVAAGTTAEVAFGIEHGCDGSPVVKVEVEVPEGVTDVEAVPGPDGWSGSVADGVVTFVGGPQPADEPLDVAIRATFPDTPDASIGFPTVQTCEEGEIAWIQPVVDGEEEPESPAPTLLLTDGPPSAAQLAPEEEGDHAEGDHHDDGATTTAADTSADSDGDDDGSGTNPALVVGGLVVVVALVAGGVVLVRRRSAG